MQIFDKNTWDSGGKTPTKSPKTPKGNKKLKMRRSTDNSPMNSISEKSLGDSSMGNDKEDDLNLENKKSQDKSKITIISDVKLDSPLKGIMKYLHCKTRKADVDEEIVVHENGTMESEELNDVDKQPGKKKKKNRSNGKLQNDDSVHEAANDSVVEVNPSDTSVVIVEQQVKKKKSKKKRKEKDPGDANDDSVVEIPVDFFNSSQGDVHVDDEIQMETKVKMKKSKKRKEEDDSCIQIEENENDSIIELPKESTTTDENRKSKRKSEFDWTFEESNSITLEEIYGDDSPPVKKKKKKSKDKSNRNSLLNTSTSLEELFNGEPERESDSVQRVDSVEIVVDKTINKKKRKSEDGNDSGKRFVPEEIVVDKIINKKKRKSETGDDSGKQSAQDDVVVDKIINKKKLKSENGDDSGEQNAQDEIVVDKIIKRKKLEPDSRNGSGVQIVKDTTVVGKQMKLKKKESLKQNLVPVDMETTVKKEDLGMQNDDSGIEIIKEEKISAKMKKKSKKKTKKNNLTIGASGNVNKSIGKPENDRADVKNTLGTVKTEEEIRPVKVEKLSDNVNESTNKANLKSTKCTKNKKKKKRRLSQNIKQENPASSETTPAMKKGDKVDKEQANKSKLPKQNGQVKSQGEFKQLDGSKLKELKNKANEKKRKVSETAESEQLDRLAMKKPRSIVPNGTCSKVESSDDKRISEQSKRKLKELLALKAQISNRKVNKSRGGKRKLVEENVTLRERMISQLKSARFRSLNETLYTNSSNQSKLMFKDDPDAFKAYHTGFMQQVQQWPLNPVDVIIESVKKLPRDFVIADFGCGEAKLANSVPHKVHSLDFVALNDKVTACDMAHSPLLTSNINVAVFCLSLMGSNLKDYLLEANRVLKKDGILKIAEVESRFDDVKQFIKCMLAYGFRNTWSDLSNNHFYFLDFQKVHSVSRMDKNLPEIFLKACLYKKR